MRSEKKEPAGRLRFGQQVLRNKSIQGALSTQNSRFMNPSLVEWSTHYSKPYLQNGQG
ncbi:MAG: hypothetical protein ABSB50_17435 [Terracidiphilus sp.]